MRRIRIGAVLVGLAVLATACHGTQTTPSGSGSGPANATFTYDTYTNVMVGWDPSTAYSNEIIAMSDMYETLTRYDSASQTVKPLLATSWRSTKDAKTWTFTLREGVTFHTGRPMTSADVKASVERTIKLNQGAAYIWGAVKSIATPSPTTVVFSLKYAAPLDLIASADYAAYIFDTKASGSQDLGKWFESGHEAGTGPYQLDQWNKGQETELRLKAFPNYWGGWSGSHYANLVYRVVPSSTTAAQLLRAKEVTWVEQMTPQLWQSFQGQDGFSATTSSSWQTLLAMLNTQTGALADPRIRQAVSDAIDWNGAMAALHGSAQLLSGVIPPGLWGHTNGLEPTTDVAQATSLLQQAGYGPNGKPLSLSLTYTQGDDTEQLLASLMKADLKKVNIDLNVQGLAWPTQWAKAKSSDTASRQDILLFYWWPDYADPYSWFINLFHTENPPYFNLTYYSNPKLDTTMQRAEVLAGTDRGAASTLYDQMQQTIHQDVPAISASTVVYQRAMLSSVQGYVDNPAYPNVVFVYDLQPAA
ncbi:MAG TPA: ABC transporter substrate-binding protein [Actinomycetota bacterium]|nr:ABC transporter substrate-binding protein [Actinomycetota bacterium]